MEAIVRILLMTTIVVVSMVTQIKTAPLILMNVQWILAKMEAIVGMGFLSIQPQNFVVSIKLVFVSSLIIN